MKKISFQVFILIAMMICPFFVQAEVRDVTVHGTLIEGNWEQQILNEINEQRRNANVNEIQIDQNLEVIARQRAIEIGTYYDGRHYRPNLTAASTIMDEYGISYLSFGENLAAGYTSVDDVMDAWISSAAHYNNIISSRYGSVGIGIYKSCDNKLFWVLVFNDSLNSVYSPDINNLDEDGNYKIIGDYLIKYEDSIYTEYTKSELSNIDMNIDDSLPIDFHITTLNEITNSNIPLYLLNWYSSNQDIVEIENNNNVIYLNAKKNGSSTIYASYNNETIQFIVNVNSNEGNNGKSYIKVLLDHNLITPFYEYSNDTNFSNLVINVDEVSKNGKTLYTTNNNIINDSNLDVYFCSNEECTDYVRPIQFTSSNTDIVDYINGKFIFNNSGTTTITAIFENGLQVVIPIEVVEFKFDKEEYNLFKESSISPQILSVLEINQYFSDNNEIAYFDEEHNLICNSSGTVTIHAISNEGIETIAVVNVFVKETISINNVLEEIELTEDDNVNVNISITSTNVTITYTSDNEDIATIDEDGLITGKNAGNTFITINVMKTYAKGLTDTISKNIPINVIPKNIPVSDIVINNNYFELYVNDEITVSLEIIPHNSSNKTLSWSSDDDNIASVDGNGKITAKAVGETVIYVSIDNIIKQINVKVLYHTISVNKDFFEIIVGNKDVVIVDSDLEFAWYIEDTSIAAINDNGEIEGLSDGDTFLHITSDNQEVIVSIHILQSISISELVTSRDTIELIEDESYDVLVTILPQNTTDILDLVWTTDNDNVALVDQNGKISAVATGSAIITVCSVNRVCKNIQVNVLMKRIPVSNIEVNKENITLNIGDEYSLIAKVLPSNATDDLEFEWESLNNTIANVNKNGLVKAISSGITKIIVKNKNGISKEITVVVLKKTTPVKLVISNDFDILFDKDTSIIENENGKVILKIEDIYKGEANNILVSTNEEVIAFYDIDYLEGNNSTFSNPKFNIRIPLDLDFSKYESIYVAYVVDGKIMSIINANIHDGIIEFQTDHFSKYAIIGILKTNSNISISSSEVVKRTNNPKTGNNIYVMISLLVLAFLILGILTYLITKYKKGDRY